MIKELGISVKKGGLFIYVRRPPCWKKKLKSYFLNKDNDIKYFLFMSFGQLHQYICKIKLKYSLRNSFPTL